MALLIESFEQDYRPGAAGKAAFVHRFEDLLLPMLDHFSAGNALLQESGFPAIREHMDEHLRVPGDPERIRNRVRAGSTVTGRACVAGILPDWFRLHVLAMDSALAAHPGQRAARPA